MKLRLSALAACLLLSATAAHADGYTVRDGSGVLKTLASKFVGLVHHPLHVMEGLFGGVPTAVTMTNAGALDVTVVAGGSGTSLTKSNAADPTLTEGVTTNQVSVDLSGYARSLAKQTGTWNINNVSGTVSLPTGASTAANQTTGNTSLATIATNTGSNATAANQASVIGTKAAGTAATNSLLTGGVYNSSALTLTNGQQASLQFDANGNLKINIIAGASSGAVAQGSTTSGQTGGLGQTATTTAAPTYTTATTNPTSTDIHGSTRVLNMDSSGAAIDPTAPGNCGPTATFIQCATKAGQPTLDASGAPIVPQAGTANRTLTGTNLGLNTIATICPAATNPVSTEIYFTTAGVGIGLNGQTLTTATPSATTTSSPDIVSTAGMYYLAPVGVSNAITAYGPAGVVRCIQTLRQ